MSSNDRRSVSHSAGVMEKTAPSSIGAPLLTSLPQLYKVFWALTKKQTRKQTNTEIFIKRNLAAQPQGLPSVSVYYRVLRSGNTWVGLRTNDCRSAVSMTSHLESLLQMGINMFWSITIVFNCDGNELPTPITTQAHTGQSDLCEVSSAQFSE